VTPPRRPGLPAAASVPQSGGGSAGSSMTPVRRRAYADDPRSTSVPGTPPTAGFAPAISVDQRSMSTTSRVSYDDSGDNASLPGAGAGTPSPYHPAHRGGPTGQALPPPPVSPSLSASSPGAGDSSATAAAAGLSGGEHCERDEVERRRCMQIYVLVIRCIAYPFNAKQPTDMVRRQTKVNKQQMHSIRERFQV